MPTTTETPSSPPTTPSGRAWKRTLLAFALALLGGILVLAPRHLGATITTPSTIPMPHHTSTTLTTTPPVLLPTTIVSTPSSNFRKPLNFAETSPVVSGTLPAEEGTSAVLTKSSLPPPPTSTSSPPPPPPLTSVNTPNATTALPTPPAVSSSPHSIAGTTTTTTAAPPLPSNSTAAATQYVYAINHNIMRREMPFSSYGLEERDASAVMVATGEYHDAVLSYLLGPATLPVNLGMPHRPPPHRHRQPWDTPRRTPPTTSLPLTNNTATATLRGFTAQDASPPPSTPIATKKAIPPLKATSFFGAYWYWPTRPTAPLPSIIATNTKWLNALDRPTRVTTPSTIAMAKLSPSTSMLGGPPSAYSALPRTRGMLLSSPQMCIHAPLGGGQRGITPRQVMLVSLPPTTTSNNTSTLSELDGLYSQMHSNNTSIVVPMGNSTAIPLKEELVGLTAHRSCEWRHITFTPPFPPIGIISSTILSPNGANPKGNNNNTNVPPGAAQGGDISQQRASFTPQADASPPPRFVTSKLLSPQSRRRDIATTNMCEKGVLSARLPTDPFMLPTTTNPQPIWLNYHLLALENVLTMPLGGQPSLITGLGAAAALREGYIISPDGRKLSYPQPPPPQSSNTANNEDEDMEELRAVDDQWFPAGIGGKDGLHKIDGSHPPHMGGDNEGDRARETKRTFSKMAVNRERTSVVNIGVGSSVCSNTIRELILNTKSVRTRALLLSGFGEEVSNPSSSSSSLTTDVDATLWHLFPKWNRRRLEMISPILHRLKSKEGAIPSNTTAIFCRNCLIDIQNTTRFHDNGTRTLYPSLPDSHWVRSHTLTIIQVGDPPPPTTTTNADTSSTTPPHNTSLPYMSVVGRVRALPFNISYSHAAPSEMIPAYLDPYYLYDENADADERFRFSSGIARLTATTLGAKYLDSVGTSTQQISTRIGALHLSKEAATSDMPIEERFAATLSHPDADGLYNDTTLGCMSGSTNPAPMGRTEPNHPAHGSLHRPPVFATMLVSRADHHDHPPPHPPHHPLHGDGVPPPFRSPKPRPPSPPDTLHIPHVVSPAQCSKRTSVLYVGSSHARFPFLFHCSMLGYTWCNKIEKASHYFGVRGYRDPGHELRDPLSRMDFPTQSNVSLRGELLREWDRWGSSVSQGEGSARHEEAHRADTAPYDQLGRYEGRMAYHPNTSSTTGSPTIANNGMGAEDSSPPYLPYRFRPDTVSIAYLSQGVYANYAPHLRRFLKQLTQRTSNVSEYNAYSSPQSQPEYTPYPSLNLSAPLTPSELQYASTFFTHVVFTPSVWEMNFVDMTAYDHSRDVSEGVLALHALFPRAKIVVINQHYHHTPVLHPGQQRARFPGAVCRTPSVVARYRDGVLCGISNHSMAAYQRESKVAMRKGSFVDVSTPPIPPSHQVELLDVFPQTRESPVAFFTDNHGHHYVDVAGEALAMRLLRDHVCPPSTVYIRKMLPPNPRSNIPRFVMRPVSALLYGVVVSKRLPTLLQFDAGTTTPNNATSKVGDGEGASPPSVMSADGVLSRPLPSLSQVTSSPLATFREIRIMHVDTIHNINNTSTSPIWEGVDSGGVQLLFPLSKKPMEEDSRELCRILKEEYRPTTPTDTPSQQQLEGADGFPPAPSFIPDPMCSCLRPSTLAWFPKQCRQQFPHVMEYDESRLYHG